MKLSRFSELSLYLTLCAAPIHEVKANECMILNLTTALSRALNYNRQLLDSLENVTGSRYQIDLASSEFNIEITPNSRAGYVGGGRKGRSGWSIGSGVDVNKKFKTGTQVSIGPTILKINERYHTDLRAVIVQPLLRGLGKEYQQSNLFGAQFALRTAYRNLHIAQVQLIIRTVQALYDVVKAEKSLEFNQKSFERVQTFYQAAKLKEKIGLADALDVYRAEIELRHAEEAFTSAEERLQESEDILRDLLALPLDTCIKVDLSLVHTPHTMFLEEAIELALAHRIEMDQIEDQQRESHRLARFAKKNLYPELNLVFNYSNCGQDEIFTRSCTRRRESTWGIGVTTSTDVDPLAERIAYEQSLLDVESASRECDQIKANIILDVKKTLRQLQRAYQRIELQENQIKTAQGELQLAKIKFDRGMADNFNVIQAEKTLRGAQQAYWSALIDHIIGEFQLLAVVGLLIDKPSLP